MIFMQPNDLESCDRHFYTIQGAIYTVYFRQNP